MTDDNTTAPAELIHRASGDPRRVQRLGPYVIEAPIAPEEERAGTVYRVRIEPHARAAVSYHRQAEEYNFVLSGAGKAVLDGREVDLRPGDFLRLPPGATHAFVTGDDPLEMLDVHTPGCRPDRDTFFVGDAPEGFRS